VLYVGGTGTISWSCVRRSLEQGDEILVLNRGQTTRRMLPDGAKLLAGDAQDEESLRAAVEGLDVDAVVNFVCFNADQARSAVAAFRGRTQHYVHISSAATYQKPPRRVPYLESTPLHSPGSPYAGGKIAAEGVLMDAYEAHDFPVTIVRPSHTYDDINPPLPGDWTVVERIARGAQVVVPGDGTSLWTLTHAEDFAVGLVGLLGNPQTRGEAFHITSEFVYSWNQIYEIFAAALGRSANVVHVTTDQLALAAPEWFWSELIRGDLQYSVIFDNSKIRCFVPEYLPRIGWDEGARRMAQHRAERPEISRADARVDAVLDRVLAGAEQAAAAFSAQAR
jgi:nucleoside-diphosphate-sugar epimerase